MNKKKENSQEREKENEGKSKKEDDSSWITSNDSSIPKSNIKVNPPEANKISINQKELPNLIEIDLEDSKSDSNKEKPEKKSDVVPNSNWMNENILISQKPQPNIQFKQTDCINHKGQNPLLLILLFL